MPDDDVVEILDSNTNEVVNHCFGPTAAGGCPAADQDGVVLCHGCRIAPSSSGPEYWNLLVPQESHHCPRAWNLDSIGY